MKKTLAIALALTAFAASAFAAAQPQDKILATVNGHNITQADLDKAIAGINPQQRVAYETPEGRQALLENIVDFRIFAQSGRDQKLQNTDEFKRTMADVEEQLLFRMATEKILQQVGKTAVTDADAQKYYNEHKEIFQVPAAIRASHILIRSDKNMPKKDQDAAQKKAAELIYDIQTKKVTFEDAARDNSADGTRSRGGDLGFFSKGQMVPPFEKAAFALKKGEMTSKPVKTEFGWHIIKVTDTRDASIRSFDDVKEDIKADMQRDRQVEAVEKERDALRARYGVKITAPAPEDAAPAPNPAKPAK